jgi:GNAT superfamily N-acetyltransferase
MMETRIEDFTIRPAVSEDAGTILELIQKLAEYENMEADCVATEEELEKTLFGQKSAEVMLGFYRGRPVAYALFFHNYSTFLGRPGIYLEDLFVIKEMRGRGMGKAMLSCLAKLAIERDCGRLEWSCLDWNAPSIHFYRQLGAKPMEEWTTFRADGKALGVLAEQF